MKKFAAIVITVLVLAGTSFADIITFKNGDIVEGTVIKKDLKNRIIIIETEAGKIEVPYFDVTSIKRKETIAIKDQAPSPETKTNPEPVTQKSNLNINKYNSLGLNNKYSNEISIGYLPWGYGASYTLKLSNKMAISVDLSYIGWSYSFAYTPAQIAPLQSMGYTIIGTPKYTYGSSLIGLGGTYEIFLMPKALEGFFIGPDAGLFIATSSTITGAIDYTKKTITFVETDVSSIIIRLGGKIGYRMIFEGGFAADASISPAFIIGSIPSGVSFSSFVVGFGARVGLVF